MIFLALYFFHMEPKGNWQGLFGAVLNNILVGSIFMDGKLFVIPVYSSNEDVFYGRWKDKMISLCKSESYKADLIPLPFVWKYNQIVAVIEVYKQDDNLEFIVYKRNGNIHFCHVPKKEFVILNLADFRIGVTTYDTNKTIREKILNYIRCLVKSELKGRYVDLDLFENQFKLMDIRGLFCSGKA